MIDLFTFSFISSVNSSISSIILETYAVQMRPQSGAIWITHSPFHVMLCISTHQAHQSRFYYCFDDQFTIQGRITYIVLFISFCNIFFIISFIISFHIVFYSNNSLVQSSVLCSIKQQAYDVKLCACNSRICVQNGFEC